MNSRVTLPTVFVLMLIAVFMPLACAGTGTNPGDKWVQATPGSQQNGAAIRDPVMEGERSVWQPVSVSFRGPEADEMGKAPNPFLDYRLQVSFTGPSGQAYDVPGYFDGDGRRGGFGDVWRVRFTPDEAGAWSFKASFRKGKDVAVSLDPSAGEAVAPDGQSARFVIAKRDVNARGFLDKGRLVYVPGKFYLKTLGDNRYWLKGGCDSPENFLAYSGFDNTSPNPDNPDWFHDYDRHKQHWLPGDPDWGGGQGKGIIGAINYLASQHVNSIYFMPMNIGGDGQDVWPFAGQINRRGNKNNDNLHYDIGKLYQWEKVFAHAQRKGLMLHCVFNERELPNKQELDGTELGVERKLYYREIIARFGHHNALVWNLSEEYEAGRGKSGPFHPDQIKQFAEYVKAIDPYDHPLTVHNAWRSADDPFYGDKRFDLTSLQDHPELNRRHGEADAPWYGERVERVRKYSLRAGRPLPVMMDELCHVMRVDDEQHDLERLFKSSGQTWARKHVIYPVFFSGGQIEHILDDLLATDDFAPYENLWRYTFYARKFLEEHTPFWDMQPMDELLTGEAAGFGEGGQVFAKPGEVYAIHLPKANPSGVLDLRTGRGEFEMRWYDPRSGEFASPPKKISGGHKVPLGIPPRDIDEDWVVLIKAVRAGNNPSSPTGP